MQEISKAKDENNKGWWKQVLSHLTFYVLIAIIAGILLGVFYPATAIKMEWLGRRFIDLIKIFIGPIIFLTINYHQHAYNSKRKQHPYRFINRYL